MNKYRICQHLVPKYGSEATILYSIPRLKQRGDIDVVKVDSHARGGHESEYYAISTSGLVRTISWLEDNREDQELLDHIATKYKDKVCSSVFSIWHSFVEAGIVDLVRPRLALWCYDTAGAILEMAARMRTGEITARVTNEAGEVIDSKKELESEIKICEDIVKTEGLDFILTYVPNSATQSYLSHLTYNPEAKKWTEAARRNSILRKAMIDAVSKEREKGASLVRQANGLIEWLQKA